MAHVLTVLLQHVPFHLASGNAQEARMCRIMCSYRRSLWRKLTTTSCILGWMFEWADKSGSHASKGQVERGLGLRGLHVSMLGLFSSLQSTVCSRIWKVGQGAKGRCDTTQCTGFPVGHGGAAESLAWCCRGKLPAQPSCHFRGKFLRPVYTTTSCLCPRGSKLYALLRSTAYTPHTFSVFQKSKLVSPLSPILLNKLGCVLISKRGMSGPVRH